jgi:hypothetical protein
MSFAIHGSLDSARPQHFTWLTSIQQGQVTTGTKWHLVAAAYLPLAPHCPRTLTLFCLSTTCTAVLLLAVLLLAVLLLDAATLAARWC